jgi:hypothetical protein
VRQERVNKWPNSMTDMMMMMTMMMMMMIEKTLEEKQVCSSAFLNVAQAFDKVWHEGVFHKIEPLLPMEYSQILNSYLSDRYFRVKQGDEYSGIKIIKAGVPQGSVLRPGLVPNIHERPTAT